MELGDCIIKSPSGWAHVQCDKLCVDCEASINAGLLPVDRNYDSEDSSAGAFPLGLGSGSAAALEPLGDVHVVGTSSGATAANLPNPLGAETRDDGGAASGDPGDSSQLSHAIQVARPPVFRSGEAKKTAEQEDFISHEPRRGDIVRGNARAGCGKTTTASWLCGAIIEREPRARIGYFVFGKKAQEEATGGGKFDKNCVAVYTSHAFAKKLCGPDENVRYSVGTELVGSVHV